MLNVSVLTGWVGGLSSSLQHLDESEPVAGQGRPREHRCKHTKQPDQASLWAWSPGFLRETEQARFETKVSVSCESSWQGQTLTTSQRSPAVWQRFPNCQRGWKSLTPGQTPGIPLWSPAPAWPPAETRSQRQGTQSARHLLQSGSSDSSACEGSSWGPSVKGNN